MSRLVLPALCVLLAVPVFAQDVEEGVEGEAGAENEAGVEGEEDGEEGQAAPRPLRGTVEAEVAFYRGTAGIASGGFVVGDIEGFALSPLFGVRYRFIDSLEVDASWGFTTTRSQLETAFGDDDDGGFRSGNPWLGASWFGITEGFPVVLKIGGGIAFPAAKLPEDPFAEHGDTAALVLAPGMRGLWDAWLWAPDVLTIAVRASAAARLHRYVAARLSGALGFLIPVRKDAGDDRGTETAVQLGLDLALLPVDAIAIGTRVQAVIITEGDDRFQGSIEPFFAVEAKPVLIRAGLMINLDDPYGRGFGNGNVWGARLSASLRF